MKKPYKKRVKLGRDGLYYPQFRCFGFWCYYDSPDCSFQVTTSLYYFDESSAMEYLRVCDDNEIKSIESAKHSKVIEYVRP